MDRKQGIRMKKTAKKIMFHINSLGKGGAERVVSLLSREFAEDGYQVVLATEWVEAEEYPMSEKITRIHVGLDEKQEKASSLSKQWYRVANLRKVIKAEKPDVIFSFCIKANYRATMATTGIKIPVITSVRSDPKIDYVGRKNEIVNKLFFNRAAGCVFQTQEAQSFFDEVLQKKSTIICNPVNEKFLNAKRKPPRKKIACVGRLVRSKNQMLLVKAFEKVLEKHPDYELYFYGDGSNDECKQLLIDYVNKTEISVTNPEGKKVNICLKDAVHFMGISNTLETDIADAAMFVLPSDYEGMPNALMEAMTLGLPAISTDCPCGGSRYWIEHKKNGQLFPVGDEQALTEAILYYIENPIEAEEMGQKAKETLKSAALDKVYAEWKTYMEQVMLREGK